MTGRRISVAVVDGRTGEARKLSVPASLRGLPDDALLRRMGFQPGRHRAEWTSPGLAGKVRLVVTGRESGLVLDSRIVPGADVRGRASAEIVASLGHDPERCTLRVDVGIGAGEPAVLSALDDATLVLSSQNATAPKVRNFAVVSAGGLGDNLVALNVLRQLAPTLGCEVGFASRDASPLFRAFPFVDRWMSPAPLVQDLLSEGWDAVAVLRYSARVARAGQPAPAPTLDGMRSGRFVCAHLPETLGEFAFRWDGRYLGEHLAKVQPKAGERRRLDKLLPSAPFVVVANGTDGTFQQRLTKRMDSEVVSRLLRGLHRAGVGSVQVGLPGVAFAPAEGSVDLIGRTSIEGLLHVLRKARALLACDNGTVHLASQAEIDGLGVFTMFGPTDAKFWGYPGNVNLVPAASRCPLRPCWFAEPWWHLNCVAERRGLLTTMDGAPECMRSWLDDPETVARAMLERLGMERKAAVGELS